MVRMGSAERRAMIAGWDDAEDQVVVPPQDVNPESQPQMAKEQAEPKTEAQNGHDGGAVKDSGDV